MLLLQTYGVTGLHWANKQWGYVNSSAETITLPFPFSNASYAITALDVGGTASTGGLNLIALRNNNSFNAQCRYSNSGALNKGWQFSGAAIKVMYLAAGW